MLFRSLATLKGLLLDYHNNVPRPGLDAKIIPKVIEIINRMQGFDAPIQVETKSEHKILVFPVTQDSFKGDLPPLDLNTMKPIIDVEATVVDPKTQVSHNSLNAS